MGGSARGVGTVDRSRRVVPAWAVLLALAAVLALVAFSEDGWTTPAVPASTSRDPAVELSASSARERPAPRLRRRVNERVGRRVNERVGRRVNERVGRRVNERVAPTAATSGAVHVAAASPPLVSTPEQRTRHASAARGLGSSVPPLQCTGTLPRAEGAVAWDAGVLTGSGVKQSVFLSCPTEILTVEEVTLRWCTVVTEAESKALPEGQSAWWVRLDVSTGDGGKVSVKHPGCADVRPDDAEMSVHEDTVTYLRSKLGPDALEIRVRGPEYRVLPLQFKRRRECLYTATFKVSLPGQYCLDLVQQYGNYDAQREAPRDFYPYPSLVFLFSDIPLTVSGKALPAPPLELPACTPESPGRWVRKPRSSEQRHGWLVPTSSALENAPTQHLGCYFPTGSPDDYEWVQEGCAFAPVPRSEVAPVLAGMTILFTGDSQVRNMWVMLCRLLKLKYPGDEHEHDAHVTKLSDDGFCATGENGLRLCWRTDYVMNRMADDLLNTLPYFDLVFFNPATHWRASAKKFDPRRYYGNFVSGQFKRLHELAGASASKLVLLAPFSHSRTPNPHFVRHRDKRTPARLRDFGELAHAAWLEAGFTDPYQYMPFANDIALPFTDCTFDGSHYDYQVVENVLRMLVTSVQQRFPDGIPERDPPLLSLAKFRTAQVIGPGRDGRVVLHYCTEELSHRYIQDCLRMEAVAKQQAAQEAAANGGA